MSTDRYVAIAVPENYDCGIEADLHLVRKGSTRADRTVVTDLEEAVKEAERRVLSGFGTSGQIEVVELAVVRRVIVKLGVEITTVTGTTSDD